MKTRITKIWKDRIFQVGLAIIAGLFTIAAVIMGWILSNKSAPENEQSIRPSLPDSGIIMVLVPAGDFLMGTDNSEVDILITDHSEWQRDWFSNETPKRKVYLVSFFISKYEITNEQYGKFLKAHPEYHPPPYWNNQDFNQPKQPIVGLDWNDAIIYCDWLTEKTGKDYKLPTEAQWERAARGKDARIFPWGQDFPNWKANFQNQAKAPLSVGTFPSGTNELGLFDMAGNVAEWCSDWYDEVYYHSALNSNPQGSRSGHEKVVRGGSWQDVAFYLRCAARMKYEPNTHKETIGFRIVIQP